MADQLETLQNITDLTVGAASDLVAVTQLIVRSLSILFGTTSCGIRLYDKETDEFSRQVGTDPLQHIFDLPPRPDGVNRHILNTKKPRYLEGEALVAPTDGGPTLRKEVMALNPKAAAYLPLLSKGEVIGVLYIYISTTHRFSKSDKQILELYADQAAIAIQNTRLFQRERQRANALALLQEVSAKVSSTLAIDKTLASIVEGAMRLTATTSGVIHLVDETGQSIIHSFEFPPGFQHPVPRLSQKGSMTRTVIDTGLPMAVPDITKEQRVNPMMLEKGVRSLIALPIKLGGKVVGVLQLTAERPHQFAKEEQSLLLALANHAAIAIQNAHLYKAEQNRADTVQVLQEISKSISATLDLDAILHQIVNGAAHLVRADSAVIHLFDETQDLVSRSYEFPAGSGHPSPSFSEKSGLAWMIHQTGRLVEVSNIHRGDSVIRERDWEGRRALIGLPLKLAGRVSGVLILYSLNPRVFTSSEKDLLVTLTEQAALAIDNAQRYEQRARDIAALEEINAAIATKPWSEIADLIALKATELSQADYGAIWLVEGDSLTLGALRGREDVRNIALSSLPIDEHSIEGWVALTHQAYSCADTRTDPHYRMWQEDIWSSVAVPISLQGQVVGTLSVESTRPYAFSEYQVNLLQSLANQAGVAFQNVRLYGDLQRRITELEALTEIGHTVSSLAVDRVLDLVYSQMCRIMDLSDAQVQFAFYDQDKEEVSIPLAIEQDNGRVIDVVRWSEREPPYRMQGEEEIVIQFRPRSLSSRFGLTEYVIQTRAPILIAQDFERTVHTLMSGEFQVREWPRFGRFDRPTHSWLAVPMLVGGRAIGVISIQSLEQERAFRQDDVELLSAVANQAAVAIENARLYTDLDQKVKQLSELQAALVAQKQLATLGTAMATLQHRINNTFSVIVPNVTRLRQRVDASDKTIMEILDIIERNVRYTSDIIARIQEPLRESEIQDVNVNAVLLEAVAWAKEKWETGKPTAPISLKIALTESLPQIAASSGQLTEIFRNLLDNAHRAMSERGGELIVQSDLADATICVRVRDTGPGISPAIMQRLFVKPVPSKGPGGGAGLGLWLSRLMLQSIGGNITVEGTGQDGTTMLVQLPVSRAS